MAAALFHINQDYRDIDRRPESVVVRFRLFLRERAGLTNAYIESAFSSGGQHVFNRAAGRDLHARTDHLSGVGADGGKGNAEALRLAVGRSPATAEHVATPRRDVGYDAARRLARNLLHLQRRRARP